MLTLLIGVALVGLGFAIFWNGGARAAEDPAKAAQPTTTTGVPTGRPQFTLAQDVPNPDPGRVAEAAATVEAEFDGTGTIAGHLFSAPNTELPESWTLIIEPSSMLTGKERAVRRVLERTRDEVEFRITDLPQAGYVVRATAPGMNSSEVHVLLAKGFEYQYVNLKLSPSGFIDGGLATKNGEPVDGVAVILESVRDKVRVETETDLAGNYLFRDVLDGEYKLYFGSTEGPLLPPESILFQAPSLRVPTREIEHDGVLVVRVTDEEGTPLSDVHVRGWGSAGGMLDARTDTAGETKTRFLPAGKFKLFATLDTQTARAAANVSAGTTTEVILEIGN